MGIRNIEEDVILVALPPQGERRSDELKAINEVVGNRNDCNVLMDFSRVEIMNSWDLSNLQILQNLLAESSHKLILCNVKTVTKCIFVVAGLSDVFTFAENGAAAMRLLGKTASSVNAPRQ